MSASNFSSVKLPADLVQLACDAAQPLRRSAARSLGGRRNVGCKLTAAVYFLPISCQISRYSAAKSSKTIPSLGPIFAQTPSAAQAPSGCAAFLGEDAYKRLKLRFNKPPPQIPNNHVRVVHPLALARSISNSQARHFGMAAFPG